MIEKTMCCLTLGGLLLLWSASALACSVPVFRYALERWRGDPYAAVLLYRETRPAFDEAADTYLKELQELGVIWFSEVDVSAQGGAATKALMEQIGDQDLPVLVFALPPKDYEDPRLLTTLAADAVSVDALKNLCESPLRKTVADRLRAGQAAVWVFMEGPDAQRNQEALGLLESALEELEKELRVPEQLDATPWSGQQIEDIEIRFSTVTLPRDLSSQPAEQAFKEMLLRVEDGFDPEKGPMVFPVFGRGRALTGLMDKGITRENIAQVSAFLVGPCSCQIKAENPGMDLLMAVDWQEGLESYVQLREDSLPPLVGYSAFVDPAAAPTTTEPVVQPVPDPTVSTQAVPETPAMDTQPSKKEPEATEPSPTPVEEVPAKGGGLMVPLVGAVVVFVILAAIGSLLVRTKQ